MSKRLKLTLLCISILLITWLHNIVTFDGPLFLNVYQRLYYIPIVLAAYWFGLKGALLVSIASTLSYPHHGHFQWPDRPFYELNQYAEMIMFNIIAIVTGILSDLETRQRNKYEKTSIELEEAYRKLRDSFEQARKTDRLSALGELSAGMAHEIRNPLASIKGGIDILEEEIDRENPRYEFIAIIKKEISRLDSIISEFLTYAKPMPPHKSICKVNEIINSICLLLKKEAERQDVKIIIDLADDIPELLIDGEQIKQAILNIILNGIQAASEGREIIISSGLENEFIFISVSDSGKGIPENVMNRLFDPFFTTKDDGTGLGLSISMQILKSHGGDIEVKNLEGKGPEFKILIPK